MDQNQIAKYIQEFELSKDQMKFIDSNLIGLEQEASNWLVSELVQIILDSRKVKPYSVTDAWSQVEFIFPVLCKKLDMIWHTCWSCDYTETENYCERFKCNIGTKHFKTKNPCKEYKFDGILDD